MSKNKYWSAVIYPENMLPDWDLKIDDLLQVPFAYCLHNLDKDSKSEHRKDHVHLILAFSNTTTEKHALEVVRYLNAPGKNCCSTIQPVISIRHMYDYLIHDTDSCRKAGKELYQASARITGNNFDIGSFEQLSVEEKRDAAMELAQYVIKENICNFADFFMIVSSHEKFGVEKVYREALLTYSGFLERIIKGNYHKYQEGKKDGKINGI